MLGFELRDKTFQHVLVVAIALGSMYGYNCSVIASLASPLVLGYWNGTEAAYTPSGELECRANADWPFDEKGSESVRHSMEGFLVSSILFGGLFGAFLGPYVAETYGRRAGIFLCSAISVLCSIMMAVSLGSYGLLCFFRVLLGLSGGISATVGPLYITEVSPEDKKETYGVLYQVSVCAWIVIAQLMNSMFTPSNVPCIPLSNAGVQFLLSCIPATFMIGYCHYRLPESEQWFGSERGHVSIIEDLKGWSVLFEPENRRWLVTVVGLPLCQQLTGVNAIIFYGPVIIKHSGISNYLLVTFLCIGVFNLVSVFVSLSFVKRFGPAKLMAAALYTMTATLFLVAIAFLSWPLGSGALTVFVILLVMVFLLAFETGPGPMFFVILSGTFPENIKASSISLANVLAWAFNIFVSFFFPVLTSALGDPVGEAQEGSLLVGTGWTFMLLAIVAAGGSVFVKKWLTDLHEYDGEFTSLNDGQEML